MKKDNYGIFYNKWVFDKNIKNELRILLIISSLSSKLGYCTASNEYLSDKFGINKDMISKKIKRLEKYGYIKCEYTYRGSQIVRRKIYLTSLDEQ